MKYFFLRLDKNQYFKFKSFKPIDQLLRLADAQIIFHNNKDRFVVGEDCAYDLLESLIFILDKALHGQAKLDASITKNIGYMWNQELHEEEGLKYENDFWVGLRNHVWSSPGMAQPNLTTWIYNDAAGRIIIEVTENYFWHHLEKTEGQNYITYRKFMASYRPYFIQHISCEVAKEWMESAQALFAIIKENDRLDDIKLGLS